MKKSWDVALGPLKQVCFPFNFFVVPMITLPYEILLGPNESSHNVHGWKLNIHISNYDGWNVSYQTH